MISFFRVIKIIIGLIFIGVGLYGRFVYNPEGDIKMVIFILFVGLASMGMGFVSEKKLKRRDEEEKTEEAGTPAISTSDESKPVEKKKEEKKAVKEEMIKEPAKETEEVSLEKIKAGLK